MAEPKVHRAGESVEDFCRACKTDRLHTIIAVDVRGTPLRVVCGYCDSEHHYRGGPRIDVGSAPKSTPPRQRSPTSTSDRDAMPIVSERERTGPVMSVPNGTDDLELLLRRVLREESGVNANCERIVETTHR